MRSEYFFEMGCIGVEPISSGLQPDATPLQLTALNRL